MSETYKNFSEYLEAHREEFDSAKTKDQIQHFDKRSIEPFMQINDPIINYVSYASLILACVNKQPLEFKYLLTSVADRNYVGSIYIQGDDTTYGLFAYVFRGDDNIPTSKEQLAAYIITELRHRLGDDDMMTYNTLLSFLKMTEVRFQKDELEFEL